MRHASHRHFPRTRRSASPRCRRSAAASRARSRRRTRTPRSSGAGISHATRSDAPPVRTRPQRRHRQRLGDAHRRVCRGQFLRRAPAPRLHGDDHPAQCVGFATLPRPRAQRLLQRVPVASQAPRPTTGASSADGRFAAMRQQLRARCHREWHRAARISSARASAGAIGRQHREFGLRRQRLRERPPAPRNRPARQPQRCAPPALAVAPAPAPHASAAAARAPARSPRASSGLRQRHSRRDESGVRLRGVAPSDWIASSTSPSCHSTSPRRKRDVRGHRGRRHRAPETQHRVDRPTRAPGGRRPRCEPVGVDAGHRHPRCRLSARRAPPAPSGTAPGRATCGGCPRGLRDARAESARRRSAGRRCVGAGGGSHATVAQRIAHARGGANGCKAGRSEASATPTRSPSYSSERRVRHRAQRRMRHRARLPRRRAARGARARCRAIASTRSSICLSSRHSASVMHPARAAARARARPARRSAARARAVPRPTPRTACS